MNPILIGLAALIVVLATRIMIKRAPNHGKPLILRLAVILMVLIFAGLILRSLIPLALSILGGYIIYRRPILQAFGLWKILSQQCNRQANRTTEHPAMSIKQAYDILGIDSNAGRAKIIRAHKQLMARNHPDKGGSDYLAQKINGARDLLLKQPGLND
jgi:DnaJ family protein C protein 19